MAGSDQKMGTDILITFNYAKDYVLIGRRKIDATQQLSISLWPMTRYFILNKAFSDAKNLHCQL
jgi:hypothetical protein